MFIIFGKMLETVTRDDAHFSMSFWIFELIYIVFELEQINPIIIFIAPMILKHFVELWNNPYCIQK